MAEGFTKEDPSAFYSNTSVDIDTGGGLISYLNVSYNWSLWVNC